MATRSREAAHAMQKVSTGDFTAGGLLEPEEFDDFFRDVQEQSEVLSQARAVSVDAPSGQIPRIDVGSQLIQAVDEAQSAQKQTINQPSVPYQTTKVSLPWEITWETANETIDDAPGATRDLFVNAFSSDLEALASVGDSSTTGFTAINDGWITIAESRGSPTYNHADGGGAAQPVNKALFMNMLQTIEHQYVEQQTLVFLMSFRQKQEYKQYLTDRQTGAGDAMLMTGQEPQPYGHDILCPLSWPDNQVMLTSMSNLAYIVEDDMRMKSTTSSERNVMNDIDSIMNLLAKIDYQVIEENGVVLGNNVAAPA